MTHPNQHYRNPGVPWVPQPGERWVRDVPFSEQPRGRKRPRRLFRWSPQFQRHPYQTRLDMHLINEGEGKGDPIFKSPRIEMTPEMREAEKSRREALRNWFKRMPFVGGLLD